MSHIATAVARSDSLPSLASVQQWKSVAFALLLCCLCVCLPARGHTAGLDSPKWGLAQFQIFSATRSQSW